MEEDDPTPRALPRWVELEYKVSKHYGISQVVQDQRKSLLSQSQHMRTLAGPDASIAFTSLSSATSASLSAAFTDADPPATTTTTTGTATSDSAPPAAAQVQCHEQGVLALMQSRNMPRERVCLLDPKASLALTPSDGDAGKFTWFLFGVRPQPSLVSSPLSLSHPISDPISFSGRLGWLVWELGYPRYVRTQRKPADVDTHCVLMGLLTCSKQATILHGTVPQSFARSVSRLVIWAPCR